MDALRLDLLGELVLAAVLGGLIGWDREASGKPAGLRTNILICIGATLLTDLSISFAEMTMTDLVRADPARLAAQIVSGIGFLGAGTILHARGSVTGLTTAATLWVVAAIGIAVGSGRTVEAVGATALVLVTLYPLGKAEDYYQRRRKGWEVHLELERKKDAVEEVEAFLQARGLTVRVTGVQRLREDRLVAVLEVRGNDRVFRQARQDLAAHPDVHGLHLD